MSIAAYKLWYEYLKETDPANWSDEVRRDFSGVLEMEFVEWFREARFRLFVKLDIKADPVRFLKPGEVFNDETHLALLVDLSKPLSMLMERIEVRVKSMQGDRTRGRPPWTPSRAPYPFACRPDVSSLEIALAAYRLRKTNPDWPVWRVGNELSGTFPILQKQRVKEGDINSVSKQRVLDTVTRRYLKTAESVLAGVVVGVFPKI